MQELRLVGVDEDGGHLLLSGDGGAAFRLPVNEALRMASSRTSARPVPSAVGSAVHSVSAGGDRSDRQRPPLTPRDIQSRIRSGATAESIVRETGVDLKQVLRYEGPVLAEREYMAQLAQRVEVATPVPSSDGYRSAFGDNPAQLEDMVRYRLQAFGVDLHSVEWDAWRKPDGLWTVVVRFELPAGTAATVGEEPPAQWTFNPSRRTVLNANRWAQVLSEMEPLDGPLPSRRLSAVADRVFDFETDAARVADRSGAMEAGDADQGSDSNELLDVLRSRRGQRLGTDEDGDDALALMLAKGHVPAAHPREGHGLTDEDPEAYQSSPFPGLSLAPSILAGDRLTDDGYADDTGNTATGNAFAAEAHSADSEDTYDDGTPRLFDGVSTQTREIHVLASPLRRTDDGAPRSHSAGHGSGEPASDGGHPRGEDTAAVPRAGDPDRKIRPRRSSVPSWDEIVFGTKGD